MWRKFMARILKEAAYNAKRNAILDYAFSLVYSKGYAQMTIQDILDGLHISRGALYHYFDSKQALLQALVERVGAQATQVFLPTVQDPQLSAIEKFRRYFEASTQWKSTQKELILSLLATWYSEENTFIRQKMAAQSLKGTPRLLEPIIRQGIQEKVFTTRFPEQAALIITGVALNLTDSIIALLLSPKPDQAAVQEIETRLDAYFEAYFDTIERILGAPAGSLKVLDVEVFREWLVGFPPEPASK
jgi:TetR/AcrR family transcriptional regulator, transcriptional repressor for nem operon